MSVLFDQDAVKCPHLRLFLDYIYKGHWWSWKKYRITVLRCAGCDDVYLVDPDFYCYD